MDILAATWLSQFGAFFLAALGCAALSRRGFLPLHISAVAGVSAYAMAAFGQRGVPAAVGVVAALLCAIAFAVVTGLFFQRVNGASASLGAMAIQLLFDQYVRSVDWTGRTSGLWEGVPITSTTERLVVVTVALVGCALLYRVFQAMAASRLLILDGQSPVLSATLGHSSQTSMLVAAVMCGMCAGSAGIITALQTGIVSPAGFSLHRGLLYVSAVILVGYRRLRPLAFASLLVALMPELLRQIGLGNADASAWRGVIVGLLVLLVVIMQAPRARTRRVTERKVAVT